MCGGQHAVKDANSSLNLWKRLKIEKY